MPPRGRRGRPRVDLQQDWPAAHPISARRAQRDLAAALGRRHARPRADHERRVHRPHGRPRPEPGRGGGDQPFRRSHPAAAGVASAGPGPCPARPGVVQRPRGLRVLPQRRAVHQQHQRRRGDRRHVPGAVAVRRGGPDAADARRVCAVAGWAFRRRLRRRAPRPNPGAVQRRARRAGGVSRDPLCASGKETACSSTSAAN